MEKIKLFGKGCTVEVVEDSISSAGRRILTYALRYWRPVHSELMTHRQFSRNASSSRAIPVAKMIKQVREEPAGPVYWGKNQAGMSAREECDALVHYPEFMRDAIAEFTQLPKEETPLVLTREQAWGFSAFLAVTSAQAFSDAGYHKQVVNRLLEPWQYITVLVTATEYDNFFELRCHPDAQPEIQDFAEVMREAAKLSTPRLLKHGEWHLPYVTEEERRQYPIGILVKLSAARCARVSYLLHDGEFPSVEKDIALYDRLIVSKPMHASPIEHQATPDYVVAGSKGKFVLPNLHGNFVGWIQHRKLVEIGVPVDQFSSEFNT